MKKIFGFGRKKKSGPPSSTSDTGSVLSAGYELKEKDLSKFQRAASSGDVAKIRQLLHKQDINQADKENRTPLHLSCANGHQDVVKLLVENKAKLNVCDNDNRSPLMKAIQCQHETCATVLLEHQADPNIVDVNENAALHLAALIPSMSIAIQLLEHGANINAVNKDGCTPLILAVTENHQEMVELLVKEGADINSRDSSGRTSLMIAASNGHISLVKYLLQNNADSSIKDLTGWTADDYAVNDGHHACSQLIFEHSSKTKHNISPYCGPSKKKGISMFGRPEKTVGGGFTLGSPATDKEGADDLSQAESESSRPSEEPDSWPTSDEDDLDFSPKKTEKPSLKQLLHTKKNRKDKSETQVRKKTISEGNLDSTKKQHEDEEVQNDDENCEDDDEQVEDEDEKEAKDCEEEEEEDCEVEENDEGEEEEDCEVEENEDEEEEEEDCEVEENEDEEEEEEDCEVEDEEEEEEQEEQDDDNADEVSQSHRESSECDKHVGQDGESGIKDSQNEAAHVPEGAACTSGCGSVIELDCPDTHEVPVSLILGSLEEEDDENETSPMQSEVTMLKSCLKSNVQSHKQVTFTNTREDCNKETCIAVDRVTNSEDVHDQRQNDTFQNSSDLIEQLDSDVSMINTAGVEGSDTRVVGKHDESFSDDEVDDKSAKKPLRADTAHIEKVQASGDGIGRKVALMTELGFEDDDVESPWDSESASESPRKQSASDVAPPSVQTHMQCISEESHEDVYYCPFSKQSRSCKVQDQGWHFRQRDASDNSSAVKLLEAKKSPVLETNKDSTSNKFNITSERNKPDLMADLGLDDADDIEDASDWDSTSHSYKCVANSSPRHKLLENSSPKTHSNKVIPKDTAASHQAFLHSVPEEKTEDYLHSRQNNSQNGPRDLETQNSKTALSNGNQVAKDLNVTSVGGEKGTNLSKTVESVKLEDASKKPSLRAGPNIQHNDNNEVERSMSSQADDKVFYRKENRLVNGSMLDVFDDSSLSEISQEEDGRSSGKRAEKPKMKVNVADFSESSDTATEDSEMPNSSFKDAMLLIKQLNLDGQDSLKSLKIQNILHEYERIIEKEKGRRALLSREVKKLRKERKEVQQIMEENRELKFLLEHHKVEWESDLNNVRLTLKQEEEKRKSAEMLYDKSKEQLRKKEDQCCKEMEEKQHLELSLRNLELEMRNLKNNMKQVEEERNEAQRLYTQELNTRVFNEGVLNNLKKKNEEEEAKKLKNKHDEQILNQSSEANEKEKDLTLRNLTLQEELSTLKVEIENMRSHYQEDESRYLDENEMLKEKIEDLRKDLKMNEETLTQTVIQYNVLKTETAKMCSKIELEKHSKERLETELEAVSSRLNSTLQDLERSQAVKTDTERTLQRERDDWLRSKDKSAHELSNLRESHSTLSQQLSRAESKLNGLENELHRTRLSLQDKTLLYDNAQRDLAQAQSKIRDTEQALQVEKDHNNKNSVKQESMQERLAQITSENMQLRQQLEDVQNKGLIKERAVSDVQDRFTDIFSKLRADTERQVHIVEERNKDLITKSNELREQIYKLETEKVDRESTIRQLQQELADALKKLSMSEASLEVITRYRNDLEEEKQQLQRELEKFRTKLQDLEDQFVQSERRNHQLKNALDDKEREMISAIQKVQEFSASATDSEKAIKQLEEHIQKLEIENARIEATAKQQAGQIESLQKELLESISIRNRLEDLVTNLQSSKIGLEEKLNQNVHKQSALSQSAHDSQNLWEAELKSRSQIGVRLAEFEGLNANLSDQLTVEKKKLKRLADQKKSIEERYDQEMKRNNKLQHEVTELKKLLKTAKKKIKDYEGSEPRRGLKEGSKNYETDSDVLQMKQKIEELSSQMERESRRYIELESANRDLQEEVSTNKKLYKNIEKLERGKRQLEEELSELKRCIDSSKRSQSYLDLYKKEVDERGRQELRHQLEEVNLFLQAHAASQDKLEQMRAESDASIRSQMEHRIQDLESELHRLKNTQLENTSERDSTKQELNRFKELFAEEQKARKSLTSKLERANERLTEANSKLLNERQRNKSLIASTFLNGSMAASPVVDTSPLARLSSSLPFNRSLGLSGGLLNTVGNSLAANQVDSYFTKMQQELEKNIAKELDQANAELEAGSPRISPVGSIAGSLRNLNADQDPVSRATQQYLEVLKKNYMI
ncbi:ankyrin repeat domain-containing protein 26 isoform X6 [Engystomops pustulosus]|uniref:ankyrin repeat domain-containing protein 26 isoform X6 n=1 Tax=Engystomops pustulosus TaxID=76066 RepID=UPI003AFB5814